MTSARRAQQIDRILAEVRQQLLKEMPANSDEIMSIDEIEHLALDVRERVGRAIAQELTQEQVEKAKAESAAQEQNNKCLCSACHRWAPHRGQKARVLVSMVGVIRISRPVYYCERCDRCTMPVDRRLKLPGHGYTALVEQWTAELSAEHAYKRGSSVLARLARVDVSAKEAQRITLAVGAWALKLEQQRCQKVFKQHKKVSHIKTRDAGAIAEQRHEPDKILYVLMDGVMTPMRDGSYREAKIGCCELVDRNNNVLEHYYSHSMDGAEQFGRLYFALSAAAKLSEIAKTVALGDGAVWIWKLMSRYYPHAVQILDWYHAMEYLHEVGRVCLSAEAEHKSLSDPKASTQTLQQHIKQWVKKVETEMWEGRINKVLKAVKELPACTEEARECQRLTLNYYQRNRKRMAYKQFRDKGYDVGSGKIESACKQVVSARIKGAGMRWSENGARAMGCLRALMLSTDLWEKTVGTWPGRGLVPAPSY